MLVCVSSDFVIYFKFWLRLCGVRFPSLTMPGTKPCTSVACHVGVRGPCKRRRLDAAQGCGVVKCPRHCDCATSGMQHPSARPRACRGAQPVPVVGDEVPDAGLPDAVPADVPDPVALAPPEPVALAPEPAAAAALIAALQAPPVVDALVAALLPRILAEVAAAVPPPPPPPPVRLPRPVASASSVPRPPLPPPQSRSHRQHSARVRLAGVDALTRPAWQIECRNRDLVPEDGTPAACPSCGANWIVKRRGEGESVPALRPGNNGFFLGCPFFRVCRGRGWDLFSRFRLAPF